MKKLFASVGLFSIVTQWLSASAWASPNPNPNAPDHAETACANVLTKNANTGPGGHISQTGGSHFREVGVVLCGLPN